MAGNLSRSRQWYALATALVAAVVWRMIAFPIFGVVPHVMLVAVLLVAFLVRDPLIFAWGMAALVLLTLYTPFFQVEYFLLVACGVAWFIVSRAFVFERTLIFLIGAVVVAQGIWWIGIGYGSAIFSVSFVLEFLYNAIVASVLFFVVVWLEEIYR
jgi:hypothetical protein